MHLDASVTQVDLEDADRLSNVLEPLLAQILRREIDSPARLIVRRPRQTDAAGLSDPFEAGRHVDAIPKQIVTLCNDIAEIDADAEQYALLDGHFGVSPSHAALDRNGAAYRFHDACEFDQ